jgi:hypothetical protein
VLKKLTVAALAAACSLVVFTGTATAMTKCLCDNGKVINSSRSGDDGCNSACKILGGGGRKWVPEDAVLEDDGTVVRRGPRHRGPAGRGR